MKNKHDFSKQSALKIKVFKKCQQQKTCPQIDILQWKKIEKDSDNFWHRKLTLKVRNWHFSIAWFRADVDLIFYSIKLPFDAEVNEKFLNVI